MMNKSDFLEPIVTATHSPDSYTKTKLPDWNAEKIHSSSVPEANDPETCWEMFQQQFKLVNGIPLVGVESLLKYLIEENLQTGYLDPALDHILLEDLKKSGRQSEGNFDESDIDRYQFGITRAAGIIAETGTVILKESSTSSRLAALTPWVHIAILEQGTPIYPTLLDAINDLGDDPYIVFATGPSKTADVEGILIKGVHGPGVQMCCKA